MDGSRFDELTRRLATGTSRRNLIKSGLAAVVASVVGTGSRDSAGAAVLLRAVGVVCSSNSNCSSGLCGSPDYTGRRRCQCTSGTDCPAPGGCQSATCSGGVCGSMPTSGNSCDDKNPCTVNTICNSGTCMGTFVPDGTVCGTGKGCVAGVCLTGCTIGNQVYAPGSTNPSNQCESCQLAVSATNWTPKSNGTSCNDGNLCTINDTCQAGACTAGSAITCSPLDQCHVAGVCNPSTGTCSNPNKADGSACNDGNACTQTDTCQAGVCVGGNPVVCTASDLCHLAGVCDTRTGTCSNPIKPNGTSCNDQNACTQTDTCQEGNCTGANPVVCSPPDQCHQQGTCNTNTGTCEYLPVANGTICNDGNACTQTDTCQAGVCTGGNPIVCTASDQCHDAGTCNPATGQCSNPTKANGSPCEDGDLCSIGDSCQTGICTSGTPKVCTALNQCHTAGVCNTSTGICSNPNKANGSACNDGNACTQTDTCQAGVCTGGNPIVCTASDQCHDAGVCNPSTGICSTPNKANGTACNDGNACTQTDTCQAGVCVGSNPVVCTALDSCHDIGVCNTQAGVCTNPLKPDGASCNDGNACTQTDTCQAGVCSGANPVVCAAPDQCHDAGTCNPSTGQCIYPSKANGTACNDNDACTQTDTCQNGTCVGGNPVVCTASDQCHSVGSCNPATGTCSNPPKANGTTCNDGNACITGETCQSGSCTGGSPVVCTALDQCHTAGVCNTSTGTCSNPNKANGTACNDENACTQTDTCQAGVCVGSNPVVCTASDQCHDTGICNPTTGVCSNPLKANGASCSDGNACTTGETCQNGTCAGGTAVVCTAIDQCRMAGVCNSSTGICSNPNKANGTSCNDGNACTQTDTCQSGTCVGSNPVVCTALDQCHDAGICNPSTGVCTNPNKANGTSCNDGDSCTQTDTCQNGTCVGSNPVICSAIDDCHIAGTCSGGTCSNPAQSNGTACAGGTCCGAHCCPAGRNCCGSGANFGCCVGPCCGGVCCEFANSKCCSGQCYVGVTPPC